MSALPDHDLPLSSIGAQIRLLTFAIQEYPGEPVNYLMRAEEWLMLQEWENARSDFLAARQWSQALLAQSAWGYIYQAYLDRAEAGLRQLNIG
jgi:hypothetical protein